MQSENHHQPNKDQGIDLAVERWHKQWPTAGTAATGQRRVVHKKAHGYTQQQWCGHSCNRIDRSTMPKHLSRPRHHHPTVFKVTREQITDSANTPLTQSLDECNPSNFPADLPPDQSDPIPEATNGTDLNLWEQMQAFHSLPTTWAPIFHPSDTTVTSKSALTWMMSQPSLDNAWRQTYTWTEEEDSQLAALPPSVSMPRISLAMWNHWQGSNLKHRTECVDYWDHCRRCQRWQQDRCMPQLSQEPPQ